MTTKHTAPIKDLIAALHKEEGRTNQIATKIRVSRRAGNALAGMDSEDWHAASNGFAPMEDCRKLSRQFLTEGGHAADGKRLLSRQGPVIEVTRGFKAPIVEILESVA